MTKIKNITFKKIKSVKEVRVTNTYDFTVKDEHRIIARQQGSKNAFYTSNCWHPDIEDFITAKQTNGRLTKFNMSVLITDAMMHAVINHLPWSLEFPDIHSDVQLEGGVSVKELYNLHWDGNLQNWKNNNLPTKIYKTFDDANELWDLITISTYERNEPGVLFVDTINRKNNLYYCEHISATNPCGEQLLPIGGACLLGNINLTQFVDLEKRDWDYEKLKNIIHTAVRFMDNVNDLTYVPLTSQAEEIKAKRRIGLGIMGYGSALYMLKVRYGSEKALKLTDELMTFMSNQAYQASSLLANEKGVFPMYDKDKYLAGQYVKTLSEETLSMIDKYGMRNSHLMSIQPTGNTSAFANVISGGLEPVFLPEYKRTSIVPFPPAGLEIPRLINWDNKTYSGSNKKWVWISEGDEPMLLLEFNGIIYKIDKSRGLVKETIVRDYAVRFLDNIGEWDKDADWVATTENLSISEHINTMEVFSKHICSAMSKCMASETTMVEMNGQIYYLDELDHHNEEDSFYSQHNQKIINHLGKVVDVKSVYNNGYRDTISIGFSDGSTICCTYNHRIYTENGWVKAIDLQLGMKINSK